MTLERPNHADLDPQCPWLLQRIDELQSDMLAEAEPARRRHWRRQLRLVTERARCLGCLSETWPRPGLGSPPP